MIDTWDANLAAVLRDLHRAGHRHFVMTLCREPDASGHLRVGLEPVNPPSSLDNLNSLATEREAAARLEGLE